MSLLELRTEIERKAQEEISKIIESAKREAERILAEATAKSEALRNERTKTLMTELEAEERADMAITRMNWKGNLLRLKSEWCKRVFEEAEKRISQIAKNGGQEYRELLSKLILEGIQALSGKRFVVEANSRDVEAIRKELKALQERAAKIKNDEVVLRVGTLSNIVSGGVVVSVEDGAQSYNNLLDARFSAATRKLAGEVYKILFGESKD